MRNVHLSTQFILHVKLICFQVACINYVFYTKLAVPARRAGCTTHGRGHVPRLI